MGAHLAPAGAVSTGTRAAIAFLAAGATYFTLMTWEGFSDDSSAFLVPLFWVSTGVAALGLGLRSLRTPAPLVVLAEVAAVALVLHQYWGVSDALGGWLPTGGSLAEVGSLFRAALEETREFAAPMPTRATHFPALMLASGAAVVVVVDLIACTMRRVPLAGMPLLAAFTAPVSLLGGVSWLWFALAATCFVLLLAADQASRLGHWGRSLSGSVTDSQPHTVGLQTVWPTATRIGLAGIGLAVLAPALLPTSDGLFGLGGPGSGAGDDEVTIENPMLNLRRDLNRPNDVELLRVVTDDPDPRYLRLSVLDEFNGDAWLPSKRDIPPDQTVPGALPEAPGLDPDVRRTEHAWSISVGEALDSIWLPIPYPATEVQDVEGDWRYDLDTLDLMTPVEDASTEGLSYDVVGERIEVDIPELVAGPPPDRTVFVDGTQLPPTVPDWLEQVARDVTEGASSQFERAVKLQQWFREDGGFTYSVERSDEGNGTQQLQLFLGSREGSRIGYCEQFAAGMALLARELGIPARVAVGFLRPERDGDEWVYSAYDMHAWPELYFEGAGWLRFEPTPAAEDVAAPSYTVGRVPTPEDIATPSASPSAQSPAPAPTPTRPADTSAPEEDSDVLLWVGRGALALLGVGLLGVPAVLRVLLRRRRLSGSHPGGVAEGAWAEIRATAWDLRLGWDDGATLRRRARALVPVLAPPSHAVGDLDPVPPVAALERLVLLLERSRFSLHGLDAEAEREVPALAEAVVDAMVRGAKPSARRRATWLPVSLVRRSAEVGRPRNGTVDRAGELDRVSV